MKALLSTAVILFTGSTVALVVDASRSTAVVEQSRSAPKQENDAPVRTLRLPPWFYDPRSPAHREERIAISNDTARAVHFEQVGTSCGCTVAELASNDLPPGATTQLHVTIAPPSKPGTRSVQVRLKPAAGQPWIYQIEAPIYPLAVLDDFELHLGTLTSGETASGELTCFTYAPTGDAPARLISVTTDSPDVTAEVSSDEPEQYAEGVVRLRSTIRVTVTGQRAAGASSASISATFQRAAVGTEPIEISKTIRWRQASLFEVSPGRIVARNLAEQSKPVRATVDIRQHGAETFQILEVKCDKEFVVCSVAEQAAATAHQLQIEIDPRAVTTHFWSTIQVKTDNARQPEIVIPIAGFR